jgi:N-acetylglucosaminyldiphosphoundecaprenol N-acetyl-beta-D-mannosaminyltransferase
MERVKLFGFNFISMADYDDLLWELETGYELASHELPILITPNVDQTVKYHQEEHLGLFNTLNKAKYILPDGQPLVWVSRFKFQSLKARLTGSDLLTPLWKHIKAGNKKVSMVLSMDEIGKRLSAEHDHVSYFVPPFYSVYDAKQYSLVIEATMSMIRVNKPNYLILGLGFPKQEYLALALLREMKAEGIDPPLMFLIGASMEFYTKVKKRAPKVYQKLGVEFLHRLFSEPRRMAKRYLVDDLVFFPMAIKEIFKKTTNQIGE